MVHASRARRRESPRRPLVHLGVTSADEQEAVPSAAQRGPTTSATGQYYHHLFLAEQPDLNWMRAGGARRVRRDPALLVRPRRRRIPDRCRARARQGSAGSTRIEPRSTSVLAPLAGASRTATSPSELLLGETWVHGPRRARDASTDDTDELQLAFNFPFMFAGLDAAAIADVVEAHGGSATQRCRRRCGRCRITTSSGSRRGSATKTTRRSACALLALLTLRGYIGPVLRRRARHASGRDPDPIGCSTCTAVTARGHRCRGAMSSGAIRGSRSVTALPTVAEQRGRPSRPC